MNRLARTRFMDFNRFALLTGLILTFILPGSKALASSDLPPKAHKALYQAQQALTRNQPEQAAKILTDFLDKNPDDPPALVYLVLGNAYHQTGRSEQAWQAFSRGHELDPADQSLLLNQAITAYETRRYALAADLFARMHGLTGDPKFLYQSAAIHVQADQYPQAEEALHRLIETAEQPLEAWYDLLVHVSLKTGNTSRAEKALDQLVSRRPDRVDYWKTLAQLRLNRRDYRGGAAALEVAYRLEPPGASNWRSLADIYFYLNAPLLAAAALKHGYGDRPQPDIGDLLARGLRPGRADRPGPEPPEPGPGLPETDSGAVF